MKWHHTHRLVIFFGGRSNIVGPYCIRTVYFGMSALLRIFGTGGSKGELLTREGPSAREWTPGIEK